MTGEGCALAVLRRGGVDPLPLWGAIYRAVSDVARGCVYFRALATTRAAVRPEAPKTPPPGWVLAPVRKRPGIEVR